MQEQFLVGIMLGVLAGVVNGVFLLPMRYTRDWAWENTWLFFTIFSTGLLPWVAALVGVPHVWDVLRNSPLSFFLPGIVADWCGARGRSCMARASAWLASQSAARLWGVRPPWRELSAR